MISSLSVQKPRKEPTLNPMNLTHVTQTLYLILRGSMQQGYCSDSLLSLDMDSLQAMLMMGRRNRIYCYDHRINFPTSYCKGILNIISRCYCGGYIGWSLTMPAKLYRLLNKSNYLLHHLQM